MAILKVIELRTESSKSWEDAAQQAIAEASKTIVNIRSASIEEQTAIVEKNKISYYRTTVKISFEIEPKNGKSKKH